MMNGLPNIKVLMTADAMGGVWTYATDLSSALTAMGADVYLVTIGRRASLDQRRMLSPSVHVIESDLALEWQDPDAADLEHARDFLAAIERRIQPDIIHLNSYREANFDWHAPVLVVAHSCVNSWGKACQDDAWLSEPKWQRYSALVAHGLDRAAAWVAPTHAFGAAVSELYQPRGRGITILNGAEPSLEKPAEKQCFILAAGRMWDAAKNLATLMEAGNSLDWPVFVAGGTAGSVGIPQRRIALLGELSHFELRRHMRGAAIFASPARYEPFGLSVLEAAHAGCALVLSDIPSFRELWEGAAVFVSSSDCNGLRAALSDLCADARERAKLQRAAFRRAQRYSMRKMADAYARLYRSLLSSHPHQQHSAAGAYA
jgi:glycosyltransferase involved in cell wall biosynthesis